MHLLLDILRGIVIGIANIIPGVSGGTMAVSMGIYDKLISAVTGLFKHFKKSVAVLFPLAVGMAVGIVGFGILLEFLLNNYVLATCLTFVGLILGGLPILWIRFRNNVKNKKNPSIGISEVVCFIVLFLFGIGLPLLQGSEGAVKNLSFDLVTVILLFLLGMIASATMVIPGVSGSMVLMVLGYYSTILSLVVGTVTYLKDFNFNGVFHNVLILAPFGIGVILGIFLIAKIIEYLFHHFPSQTYAGNMGLIVSSPFAILYSAGALKGTIRIPELLIGVVLACLGAWVTWLMGSKEEA